MTQFENEQQAYEAYDEYLDEQPDVIIGSLSYSPSRVLKAVDPIAYRCGFDDFMDWVSSMSMKIRNTIAEEDE